MPDSDAELERRLAAIERALGGEPEHEGTERQGDVEDLERRAETLESRVDELDAAVQSIRGFLGGVSAVNESVERRADAAVAAVERLERRLDEGGSPADGDDPSGTPSTDTESNGGSDADEPGLRDRLRELR